MIERAPPALQNPLYAGALCRLSQPKRRRGDIEGLPARPAFSECAFGCGTKRTPRNISCPAAGELQTFLAALSCSKDGPIAIKRDGVSRGGRGAATEALSQLPQPLGGAKGTVGPRPDRAPGLRATFAADCKHSHTSKQQARCGSTRAAGDTRTGRPLHAARCSRKAKSLFLWAQRTRTGQIWKTQSPGFPNEERGKVS